jgi:exodeoxyribonuclease VII small subunit
MTEMKFDQALRRLEKLVEEMEEEEVPLEESLKKYEEGVRLARLCLEKLKQAEKKIEILKKPVGEEPQTEPFAGPGEGD